MIPDPVFSQAPHVLRLEWGWRGCQAAAARGDIVIVVDVLRFSTTCAVAAARDVSIVAAAMDDNPDALAEVHHARLPDEGFMRLSPLAYAQLPPGTRLVVKSPNGATCARLAAHAPHVLFGSIVNASAIARRVADLIRQTGLGATIIACGERWRDENDDGRLRFAIEDYLGAGAILAHLSSDKSAEAVLCHDAFDAAESHLRELIRDCASGRELIGRGSQADVEIAATLDFLQSVPVLRDGAITHSGRL